MFIRIEKNPDGSHASQLGGRMDAGWAVIPTGMKLPDTFPFVNIEVAKVTYPAVTRTVHRKINGEVIKEVVLLRPEITRLEVTSMTEGERIPVEEAGMADSERIKELEEALDLLLSGATE